MVFKAKSEPKHTTSTESSTSSFTTSTGFSAIVFYDCSAISVTLENYIINSFSYFWFGYLQNPVMDSMYTVSVFFINKHN